MKRLLLIPLLALPLIAQPVPTVNVTGTARVGSIWPHDLTFEWHCESTNAEYSIGVTGGSLDGGAVIDNEHCSDGVYSLKNSGGGGKCIFTNTPPIIFADEGTITFDAYVSTNTDGATLFQWYTTGNASNYISIAQLTGRYIRLRHKGSGETTLGVVTTNTFDIDTWFTVTAKWRKDAAPYQYIAIDGAPVTQSATNLSSFNATPTRVYVGDYNGLATQFWIDNVKVWSKWK